MTCDVISERRTKMKFLPSNMEGKSLIPIHIYYSSGKYDQPDDDILDIVYKDLDTGKKYVETIQNPKYEVWIVKPEYRNYNYLPNFMRTSLCEPVQVHYKTRYKELANILHVSPKNVKINPYVFQLDIKIEHFYLMQFKHEYPYSGDVELDIGFLDIESDMFQSTGKVVVGADPINCVSYLDVRTLTMNTFILRKDNIPQTPVGHPKHEIYENLRDNYYKQVDSFIDNIDQFTQELHDAFDEIYGKLNYHIYMFDTEIDLILALFRKIEECEPDFWFVWNLPYDEESLIKRIEYHGYDPANIISDKEMRGGSRQFYFKADNSPKAHTRKHISNIFSKSIPYDQLPLYAGIRISKGSLQSLKLTKIAELVIDDKKLDYSEYGDFKYFCYQNFKLFVMYNIKDVLLQYGIEKKCMDSQFLINAITSDCVLNYQIFTTTLTETMALRDFAMYQCKIPQVLGNNKRWMDLPETSYSVNFIDEECELADFSEDFLGIDVSEDDEDDGTDDNKKKEKNYPGAYVMSPAHIKASGTKIMGRENKYMHKHVIDQDIGAEYPTAVEITNCTNDTLVGKVFLLNPSDVEMPFYNNFKIIDAADEQTYSKIQSSSWMMELYSERDPLSFGERILGLPDVSSILSEIDDDIDDFL